MKLPGKIWVVDPSPESSRIHRSLICHSKSWTSTYGEPMPYVPASEAERLRERVKQLEGALEKIIGPYELPFPQSKEDAKPLAMAAKRREYDVAVAREALGGEEKK